MEIDFDNIDGLKMGGFQGFLTARALLANGLTDVPDTSGVYLVLRDNPRWPTFVENSCGGHFKGKDPSVACSLLEGKWIDGARVLYVGQAGGGSSSTLRTRVRAYLRFGAGHAVGHWGGRYIWQLSDAESLLYCWRAVSSEQALEIESGLINQFIKRYGGKPFANILG